MFGRVDLQKSHLLNNDKVFKITMYMQSMLCLLGQHSVYKEASQLIKQLLGLEVSGKQIQRVCNYYGEQIDPIIEANQED